MEAVYCNEVGNSKSISDTVALISTANVEVQTSLLLLFLFHSSHVQLTLRFSGAQFLPDQIQTTALQLPFQLPACPIQAIPVNGRQRTLRTWLIFISLSSCGYEGVHT